jgi:hypothetical protein
MEPGPVVVPAVQDLRNAVDSFHGAPRAGVRDFAAVCVAAADAFTMLSNSWLSAWANPRTRPKVLLQRESAVAAFVAGDGRLHSTFFEAFWSWVMAAAGPLAVPPPAGALSMPLLVSQAVVLGLAARRTMDPSAPGGPLPGPVASCDRLMTLLEVVCGGSLARLPASVPPSSCVDNVYLWLTAGTLETRATAAQACRRDPPVARPKRIKVRHHSCDEGCEGCEGGKGGEGGEGSEGGEGGEGVVAAPGPLGPGPPSQPYPSVSVAAATSPGHPSPSHRHGSF